MKKIYILLAAALMASAAQAQNFTTEKVATVNAWTAFTTDSKMRPANYVINYDNGTMDVDIYNSDLTLDHSVSVKIPEGLGTALPLTLNSSMQVILTSHLFNNDDAYEMVFVKDIYENDEYTTEYHVVNQYGEDLGTIPSLAISQTEDNLFIEEQTRDENGLLTGYNYYTIEKSTESAKAIINHAGMMMSPNPAVAGETVTLTLPDASEATVEVYDAQGRLQLRTTAVDGRAAIPAASVAPGVNPVVVKKDLEIVPAGKLIVK